MKSALVVITDGRRQYVTQCIESAQSNLKGDFVHLFIINDADDDAYAAFLEVQFPAFTIIHHDERRGLSGAVRSAWETALVTGADYIFHLEDDFIFNRKINVDKMIRLLHCEPHLAQVLLKRQPWNDEEIAAGNIIQAYPDEHTDHSCPSGNWVEHRRLFSFNPFIAPRHVLELALAESANTLERGVTDTLLKHDYSFAYYGKRDDEPRCHHIGDQRSSGYKW